MTHAEWPPLDWQTTPLAGRVLIEASAGTGKTHTIGLIFLRLLLERGLRIEQILVATFTDRAAQELRERLRLRLVEAERALRPDPAAEPTPLRDWLSRICPDEATCEQASRRLQLARADIDRAPIGTIHALCRRLLRDYPLESGAPMLADELLDESALLRECVEDFWRRRFFGNDADDAEVRLVAEKGIDELVKDVRSLINADAASLEVGDTAAMRANLFFIRRIEHVTTLRDICSDASVFSPKKRGALRTRLLEVAAAIESDGDIAVVVAQKEAACLESLRIDEHLSPSGLVVAQHDVIVALQRIRASAKSHARAERGRVIADAVAFCREEIPRRARARDAQTFSMLIDAVHARLTTSQAGAAFADTLFDAFPAALIDEFQDTDRRQFEIFDRIYRGVEGSTRGLLTMIGDPKQAIYGFRGGDIAEYLRARRQSEHRFALTVNHRSSTPLVAAVNALYAHAGGGFASGDIAYRQAQAAGRADRKPFCCDGHVVEKPLVLHRFASGEKRVGELDTRVFDDCADRIVELLNDRRYTLGGKPVSPGDIAVLAPKNDQLDAIRKRLAARGVPCAGSGRGDVLHEEIARDLELVLHAVLAVDDESALRGALCTRLLGATLRDVQRWNDDGAAFDREVERFASWRDIAHSRGVPALVQTIATERAAALLSLPDGARMLTDLRHLGDLIGCDRDASEGLESACARLSAWRRTEAGDTVDTEKSRRPRIESDAPRVQLLTQHAAKGLQFPIVFLPFVWRVSERPASNVLRFHDADGTLRFDLGSPQFDANAGRCEEEDLQERLRLLYVALTRAEYAVHVYWSDRNGAPEKDAPGAAAALDLLLHAAFAQTGLPPTDASLDALARMSDGMHVVDRAIATEHFHSDATPSELAARSPLPAPRPSTWLHSFSSITRHASLDVATSPAADESETEIDVEQDLALDESPQPADDPALLVLDAWRGRYFGNALHAILEDADEGGVWPQQRDLLARHLRPVMPRAVAGGDALEPIGRLVDRVRGSDLGGGLRLADVPRADVVSEFEFEFVVTQTTLTALRAHCIAAGCGDVIAPSLTGDTLNGMLTGFADLIFRHGERYHVLDYKTNWLGNRLADYGLASLDTAMAEHHYALQALIYTVALHRYLRGRLDGYSPERHLGDSVYLFVRAVGLAPGAGVWRRRWPVPLIEAVDRAFAGESS